MRRQQARPAPLHQPHPLRARVVPREEGAEEAGRQAGGQAVVAVRPVEPETNSIIESWSDIVDISLFIITCSDSGGIAAWPARNTWSPWSLRASDAG